MYAWTGVRENPGAGGRFGGTAGGTVACAGVVGVAVLGCVAAGGVAGRTGWPTGGAAVGSGGAAVAVGGTGCPRTWPDQQAGAIVIDVSASCLAEEACSNLRD